MFTFGRTRELEHVDECYAERATAPLLRAVVTLVHDYLERRVARPELERAIEHAFIAGESGIWETAGGWLLKLNAEEPDSEQLWRRLARHARATVRFRVASFLDEVSEGLGHEVYAQLENDKSKRVRLHAFGKWDYRLHPEKYGGTQ